MISEKKSKILKIGIFGLIVIGAFLLFPKLVEAWCIPSRCYWEGTSCICGANAVNECNGGGDECSGACGWQYNVNCADTGYLCKSGTCFIVSTGAWTKCNKFPDTSDYNGRPCAVYSSTWWLSCATNGQGVWDASERKCVQCDGGKFEKKVCGSAGTISTDTCNADLSYCLSPGCSLDGNNKCETACDPGVSPKCDDKTPGTPGNPGDPCGNGGYCDENCQCIEPCSWQDDKCGQGDCKPTERHQTCGPAGCFDGICTEGETHCVDDPTCHPCEETCSCTCPDECPCPLGGEPPLYKCPPELLGGLVPCGRGCNDPCTKECECCPCTLCHLFVLFKRIVDFATINVLFPLAVLMIVIGGIMFLTAAGDPGRIGTAKKILTSVVIGLLIIFLAWLIVDTIIMFITKSGSPFQNWSTIDCSVP